MGLVEVEEGGSLPAVGEPTAAADPAAAGLDPEDSQPLSAMTSCETQFGTNLCIFVNFFCACCRRFRHVLNGVLSANQDNHKTSHTGFTRVLGTS